jgi:hypothetical protein
MSSYNRTFHLTIEDVDLIEEALRAHGRELSRQRVRPGSSAADIQTNRVIEEDMRKGEELLGRLHDQKIFYRPKKEVYVSG